MRLTLLLFLSQILIGCASTSKSWNTYYSPAQLEIIKILNTSRPVRLLINGNVTTSFSEYEFASQGVNLEQWKEMVHNQINNSVAETYYKYLGKYENFEIVDRSSTNEIAKEQYFHLTGMVKKDQEIEIGKMLGATHFLYWTCLRSPHGNLIADTIYYKLIDINTGKILSTHWKKDIHK